MGQHGIADRNASTSTTPLGVAMPVPAAKQTAPQTSMVSVDPMVTGAVVVTTVVTGLPLVGT